jgi:hypothetical protein
MLIRTVLVAALLLLAAAAYALPRGGGSSGASCSFSLDFSAACNSGYLVIIR